MAGTIEHVSKETRKVDRSKWTRNDSPILRWTLSSAPDRRPGLAFLASYTQSEAEEARSRCQPWPGPLDGLASWVVVIGRRTHLSGGNAGRRAALASSAACACGMRCRRSRPPRGRRARGRLGCRPRSAIRTAGAGRRGVAAAAAAAAAAAEHVRPGHRATWSPLRRGWLPRRFVRRPSRLDRTSDLVLKGGRSPLHPHSTAGPWPLTRLSEVAPRGARPSPQLVDPTRIRSGAGGKTA
ncbi:hypothetical protein VTK73DRAFT_4643 [Phialemonium thermophilum]|uniref:Uncharacterized protein n=1 Tax=Phialemonium thermophilum TaxID=223376 RepID=A0ABR3V748_9PEZI